MTNRYEIEHGSREVDIKLHSPLPAFSPPPQLLCVRTMSLSMWSSLGLSRVTRTARRDVRVRVLPPERPLSPSNGDDGDAVVKFLT